MPRPEPRYATALLALAESPAQADYFGQVLDEYSNALQTIPALHQLLQNPVVAPNVKKEGLMRMADPAPTGAVASFLKLLVDKDRIQLLPEIALLYQRMKTEARGILPIQISSAMPLDSDELANICSHFCKRYGKTETRLETHVNPALIGGLRVQVGDDLYDGTLRGRLEGLRRALAQENTAK